ncbi:MAG TPA: von Willebrand factor type A domain-containing protein [Gemmataceae bacterium]|nr:von Willebrand factor type A domain-containing protein [Gemmataceae bacterium]
MTPEELEAPLTAYALNDPGLSAADRQQIEAQLASDPAARRAVEETRRLAAVLTEALGAEQAATLPEAIVTIPAAKPTGRRVAGWTKYVVAAAVLVATAGVGYMGWAKWTKPERDNFHQVAATGAPTDPENAGYGDGYDRQKAPVLLQGDARGGDMNGGFQGGGAGIMLQTPATEGAPAPRGDTKDSGAGEVPRTVDAPRGLDGKPNKAIPDRSDPRSGSDSSPAKSAPDGRGPGFGAGGYGPGTPGSRVPGPAGRSGAGGMPGAPGGVGGLGLPSGSGPVGGGTIRSSSPAGTPAPISGPAGALPNDPGQPLPAVAPPASTPPASVDDKEKKLMDESEGRDRFPQMQENPFVRVKGIDALSTFGVDVDTASYAIVRKYLSSSQLPPATAVRLEEMVNYFPYADKPPDGNDPFAVTVEMADCPWEAQHRLVRLGLKARPIDNDKRPASNLVFLIDVSGSMNAPNRLPLVKASLKLLVNQLGEKDRIAMVVYAGTTGVVLNSTPASEKEKILNALDALEAGGSTNGSGGIQQAYEVAAGNFVKGGTNRVILCTDGDWNVGTTSTDALVKLIEEKRETGVFLSVFGFGMGNLRDEMLVKLAGKGNGQYGYIDTLREANKAFVEQMGGTLVTVAKDVKIQVEFNPAVIKAYRLLGYEKRILAAKDFHDDKKDAGEMGAGHVVTALYELVPAGAPDPVVGKVDELRYQKEPAPRPPETPIKADEAFVVKMRHKKPDEDKSVLRELPIKDRKLDYERASEDFQFAAAVASFAMLLRDSQYKGQSNYGLVLELAASAKTHDPGGYRAEFVELVKKAKALSGK